MPMHRRNSFSNERRMPHKGTLMIQAWHKNRVARDRRRAELAHPAKRKQRERSR